MPGTAVQFLRISQSSSSSKFVSLNFVRSVSQVQQPSDLHVNFYVIFIILCSFISYFVYQFMKNTHFVPRAKKLNGSLEIKGDGRISSG